MKPSTYARSFADIKDERGMASYKKEQLGVFLAKVRLRLKICRRRQEGVGDVLTTAVLFQRVWSSNMSI